MNGIRLVRETDAAAIAAIYRPIVESTAISFETEAPGDVEMARRITSTLARYPWLVCESRDTVVGYAYASQHRARTAYQWSVDVSVYVDAGYRRAGIARGLYSSLLAILAAQGFFNAYAGISLPNAASVALHESLAFRPVGVYLQVGHKLGAWRDVGWWQRELKPRDATPDAPVEIAAMAGRVDWPRLLSYGEHSIRTGAP